jgi:microcystin-dependent protein
MAQATIFTAERMQEIEDTTVVSGLVAPNGHLLLSTREGTEIDAGQVKGDPGTPGTPGADGSSATPAGTIALWAADLPPANWLICDGSAVSRATYASLFNAIGTKYGVGDGSTTFNLPNLKGRAPFGKDTGQAEFTTLAQIGGAKTHIHSVDGTAYAKLAWGAAGSITMRRVNTASWTDNVKSVSATAVPVTGDTTSGTLSTDVGGNTDSQPNLPPYQVVNFIIKYSAGASPSDSELTTRVGVLETNYASTSLAIREKTARIQRALTGGGTRKVGATTVSWTTRFRAMGSGRDDLAPAGYFNIDMPPDGTVIPAIGHPTTTSVTVASGVINTVSLSGYSALYYDLPYGSDQTFNANRFHLVDYQAGPITIPPSWLLICTRNIDPYVPAVTWGDQVRQDYWKAITFANAWVDFAAGYQTAAWRYESDGKVRLKGMVKSGTVSTTVPAWTFSSANSNAELASAAIELFMQPANLTGTTATGVCRVDIAPTGLFFYSFYGGGTNAWVSLAGISWYPSGV